jgi:hypothetical protein
MFGIGGPIAREQRVPKSMGVLLMLKDGTDFLRLI